MILQRSSTDCLSRAAVLVTFGIAMLVLPLSAVVGQPQPATPAAGGETAAAPATPRAKPTANASLEARLRHLEEAKARSLDLWRNLYVEYLRAPDKVKDAEAAAREQFFWFRSQAEQLKNDLERIESRLWAEQTTDRDD